MEKYTVTLSDGSQIADLSLNGNNYISGTEITEEDFSGKLSSITITGDDGSVQTLGHCELVQITNVGDEYWFILREYSAGELAEMQVRADIDYIAAMADIEL